MSDGPSTVGVVVGMLPVEETSLSRSSTTPLAAAKALLRWGPEPDDEDAAVVVEADGSSGTVSEGVL